MVIRRDDPLANPATTMTGDDMDSTQPQSPAQARPGVRASAGLPTLAPQPGATTAPAARREAIFTLRDVQVSYAGVPAVENVTFELGKNHITAFIGPSGCGKSTLLRCLNRMNDLIPSASVSGSVLYHDQDLYAPDIDPVQVRKRIGMVFQKPNPFPKSIYENIAFGPRVLGMKGDMDEIVETALRKGALWDEVTPSACPAASSSGCASRARWPSSPTSSSWMSPARRLTRSRPGRSRTSCSSSSATTRS
jgi:ABC-type multidrug transport system fused ATPase/permease subunit